MAVDPVKVSQNHFELEYLVTLNVSILEDVAFNM